MKFTKMHGIGNDYVYINCFRERIERPSELAKKLSDRHFGIGADGLILIEPSDVADFKMDIYNADGSRARMCGNGIRCLGRYVCERGLTGKTRLTVETPAGVRRIEVFPDRAGGEKTEGSIQILIEEGKNRAKEERLSGEEWFVRVDMGIPSFTPHSIPVLSERNIVVNEKIETPAGTFYATCVSVGNPHAVIFIEKGGGVAEQFSNAESTNPLQRYPVEQVGPLLEFHPRFPDRVNVEFCRVIGRSKIEMRVWERGSGETYACGTGACAAVAAAVLNDLTDEEVTVKLLGGDLFIKWDRRDGHIYMTGAAVTVFDGEINTGI